MDNITYTSKDFTRLKQPVELSVKYDEETGFLIAENRELTLYLVAETIQDLKKEFEIHMESLELNAFEAPDNELSHELLHVKKVFREYWKDVGDLDG